EEQLIKVVLYPLINRCGLQVCRRDIPIVELLAIFATWSMPCIRASIGKIQRRIIPQLRHQMQPYLSDHLQGIVMPQLPVKKKVHDLEGLTNLLQQPLDVLMDKTQ